MNVEDCKQYIDHVLVTADEIQARLAEMAAQIDGDYAGKDLLIVSVLKGSMNTLIGLTSKMHITAPVDFMSLSTYGKSHFSTGEMAIRADLTEDVFDKDVLIVEDIVDTGFTLSWLTELLDKRGARSVEICSLLSKSARRKYPISMKYVGFEIPDEFVVGFGMDYEEKFRNLDAIVVFKLHKDISTTESEKY